jgi:hypothetical protein
MARSSQLGQALLEIFVVLMLIISILHLSAKIFAAHESKMSGARFGSSYRLSGGGTK